MTYKVKISKRAEKFISKLDGKHKNKIIKLIENLETKPIPLNKKHILQSIGNSMLCENSIEELRFYYTIENQFVVIEEIEYKGIVEIIRGDSNHKSGNKNFPNQQKTIKNLKNWFKKIFNK